MVEGQCEPQQQGRISVPTSSYFGGNAETPQPSHLHLHGNKWLLRLRARVEVDKSISTVSLGGEIDGKVEEIEPTVGARNMQHASPAAESFVPHGTVTARPLVLFLYLGERGGGGLAMGLCKMMAVL